MFKKKLAEGKSNERMNSQILDKEDARDKKLELMLKTGEIHVRNPFLCVCRIEGSKESL